MDTKAQATAAPTAPGPIDQEQIKKIVTKIKGVRTVDQIFLDLQRDFLTLFNIEQAVLYALDPDKNELYTRFPLDTIEIVRIPVNDQSLAGLAAKTLKPVRVKDVYDKVELQSLNQNLVHNYSWDKKTGFRTKQVLSYPILLDARTVGGVIQLLNRKSGQPFTDDLDAPLSEIAKAVGQAFQNLLKLTVKPMVKFEDLVAAKLISQAEVDAAQVEAKKTGTDVESILLDKHKIHKTTLLKSLSLFYNCSYVEFDPRLMIDTTLFKNLKTDFLKKNLWMPFRRDKNGIEILIDNPHDIDKVQNIRRTFAGQSIQFAVCLRRDILEFIKSMDGGDGKGSISDILVELVSEGSTEKEDLLGGALAENDSAIVRLTNQIIAEGVRLGASDIHIEPYSEKKETVVRFRLDGSCFEYMKIPANYRRAIVSRIKIMASLDIAERRKPQDGKIKFRIGENREIELRVATIPTAGRNNEDVVMRILAASEPLPLDKMHFSERNLRELKSMAEKPYGIILSVGPTGAGKTTTLHALLGYINTPERKIWTAEDPVEITQYGLRQVQVNPKIGFTFAIAMRAFLRADPDVIMVGEMRDKETADTGIEASLTGHLVFSTLHTNSAVETLTRLLDMGCDPFSFSDALLGVLAQRLCKRICEQCKEEYNPSKDEYDELVHSYGLNNWEKLGLTHGPNFKLYRGAGCPACNRSGFRGRIGLHELLIGSDRIKRLIQSKAPTEDLAKIAMDEGMTTLVQDGVEKVLQGHTTFKQVKSVAIK
jgi:type II secretory ATPase GspE/PulE/Tfp pilus assembly ATPase PilB-like protein